MLPVKLKGSKKAFNQSPLKRLFKKKKSRDELTYFK